MQVKPRCHLMLWPQLACPFPQAEVPQWPQELTDSSSRSGYYGSTTGNNLRPYQHFGRNCFVLSNHRSPLFPHSGGVGRPGTASLAGTLSYRRRAAASAKKHPVSGRFAPDRVGNSPDLTRGRLHQRRHRKRPRHQPAISRAEHTGAYRVDCRGQFRSVDFQVLTRDLSPTCGAIPQANGVYSRPSLSSLHWPKDVCGLPILF